MLRSGLWLAGTGSTVIESIGIGFRCGVIPKTGRSTTGGLRGVRTLRMGPRTSTGVGAGITVSNCKSRRGVGSGVASNRGLSICGPRPGVDAAAAGAGNFTTPGKVPIPSSCDNPGGLFSSCGTSSARGGVAAFGCRGSDKLVTPFSHSARLIVSVVAPSICLSIASEFGPNNRQFPTTASRMSNWRASNSLALTVPPVFSTVSEISFRIFSMSTTSTAAPAPFSKPCMWAITNKPLFIASACFCVSEMYTCTHSVGDIAYLCIDLQWT